MTAVITGGASGIGLALARALLERGLSVVIGEVEQAALDAVSLDLPADRALVRRTDVTRIEDVEALRDAALERFGRIDLVCNNAGVFSRFAPMWEVDPAEWRWILDVNLWGVIHGIRTFVHTLVAQGHGYVVNTASLGGIVSLPGNGPYNASKHGVVTLSEGLAAEFKQAGLDIGVTVVCPGVVDTRIREADRNRPFAVASQDQRQPGSPDPSASVAIPPGTVAEQIVAAVEAGRLYCATHPGFPERIRARIDPLLDQLSIV